MGTSDGQIVMGNNDPEPFVVWSIAAGEAKVGA
jgi:hypothetical protein